MSVVMEGVEPGPRHRDALPSIGRLELDAIKKETPDYNRYPPVVSLNVSTGPLVSPTAMYSGPPPPYSYPPTANSASALSGYISPPNSHRTGEDEKEASSIHRQSLPSIKEALGDKPLPYSASGSSGPPPQLSSYSQHTPQIPPASAPPRPHSEAPSGPPNPFSHSQGSVSQLRENPYGPRPVQNPAPSMHPETSPRIASNSHMDPRMPSIQALNPGKSPIQPPRGGPPLQTSQTGPSYEYAPNSAGSISSVNGYPSYPPQPQYPFTSQPPSQPSTFQPPGYDSRGYNSDWKPPASESLRPEEGKKPISRLPPTMNQPYGESVKRHLEYFDIETFLNEIADGSRKAGDFAHHYQMKSHQTQRSGPVPGSMPTPHEIDGMIQESVRVTGALQKLREVVISQQHALAEQRASQAYKAEAHHYDEDGHAYQDDFKGSGGFAGADAKKRRGKAAPPGRCHSCNRAETPEWRRGPDGARTLCNACGLHYAKLTRKLGPKASLAGSNLRPKNMDAQT